MLLRLERHPVVEVLYVIYLHLVQSVLVGEHVPVDRAVVLLALIRKRMKKANYRGPSALEATVAFVPDGVAATCSMAGRGAKCLSASSAAGPPAADTRAMPSGTFRATTPVLRVEKMPSSTCEAMIQPGFARLSEKA
jgi:hypothetical protein